MKVNILFVGGGKRVSMVKRFKKAAKSLGLDISIFAYELTPYVQVAPHVEKVIIGEPFATWSISRLEEICQLHGIEIIVPFMDDALPLLAEYRNNFPLAVVSYPKTVELCNDKFMSERTFMEWGIKVPSFDQTYPAIVKARWGYGSRDQYIINSQLEWWGINREQYVIQKFIKGQEYSVDCYIDKQGQIKGIVPRKRLLIGRGEVENSVTVIDPEIHWECEKILSHGGFYGPITFQFIRGEDGLYIIECNARFGGGVIVSIEAGANYPRMILEEYLNREVKAVNYEPGLLMTRSYRETFFHDYL